MSGTTHSFVVPAYGASPHLEECLASLAAQEVGGDRLVSTSTPYDGIEHLCDRYGAKLVVHGPNQGIGHDWNMALTAATTDWVTLAHQDDIYEPSYTAAVLAHAERHPDTLLVATDYYELVDGTRRPTVAMLRIRRCCSRSRSWVGRCRAARSQAPDARFGNPVPCPSVALHMALAPDFRFASGSRPTWIGMPGSTSRPGTAASGTSATLCSATGSTARPRPRRDPRGRALREDVEVFVTCGPALSAPRARAYARSYRSNEV